MISQVYSAVQRASKSGHVISARAFRGVGLKKSDPKSLAGRPKEKAKQLGQVLTPDPIAAHMVNHLLKAYHDEDVQILDPSVGPATFPLIIADNDLFGKGMKLTAVDIDDEMIALTDEVMDSYDIKLNSIVADYLELAMDGEYDYAILNPPYVRQEWIDRKLHYQELFRKRYEVRIPGTSNLYVYFLVKVLMDLKPSGQFACIVYDSWQSTQYGRWLLGFMQSHCKSLKIDIAPDQPFSNRLIDATIIYGVKKDQFNLQERGDFVDQARSNYNPLSNIQGFTPLQALFTTHRGLRLKQTDFFLCDFADCAKFDATPFLKKIGKLKGYSVPDNHPEAALLITSQKERPFAFAELARRLELAKHKSDKNISILTWFVERPDSWFIHREAPYAPIVFNYYLRNRPRHILNQNRAYADNFYGLLPPETVSPLACLAVLNSTAVCTEILAYSRNQGNGLAKIQLFEYRKVSIPDLMLFSNNELNAFHNLGLDLVERPHLAAATLEHIDNLISAIFADPRLSTTRIYEAFREISLKAKNPKEVEVCPG